MAVHAKTWTSSSAFTMTAILRPTRWLSARFFTRLECVTRLNSARARVVELGHGSSVKKGVFLVPNSCNHYTIAVFRLGKVSREIMQIGTDKAICQHWKTLQTGVDEIEGAPLRYKDSLALSRKEQLQNPRPSQISSISPITKFET